MKDYYVKNLKTVILTFYWTVTSNEKLLESYLQTLVLVHDLQVAWERYGNIQKQFMRLTNIAMNSKVYWKKNR